MRNVFPEMYRRAMRAYNLDGWHPPKLAKEAVVLGAPQHCDLCGQLSAGWALEQGPGTLLCLGCYEGSALAHRPFRYR